MPLKSKESRCGLSVDDPAPERTRGGALHSHPSGDPQLLTRLCNSEASLQPFLQSMLVHDQASFRSSEEGDCKHAGCHLHCRSDERQTRAGTSERGLEDERDLHRGRHADVEEGGRDR